MHLVGELQGSLRALEGELVEEQALHLSTMEDKEEEVLQLRTEVGCLTLQTSNTPLFSLPPLLPSLHPSLPPSILP